MAKPSDQTNYIYKAGTAPNTRAVTSQKNKIFGYMVNATEPGFKQIGAVSEFGHDESRTVESFSGIGFGDQIAELVPGKTEAMTLSLAATLMYTVNLFQATGYRGGVEGLVRSLRHHRWPFDIKQELVISELSSVTDLDGAIGAGSASVQPAGEGYFTNTVRALITFYEGCWFQQYGASYSSDAALVSQNSSVMVTDVTDSVSQYGEFPEYDTGLSPVVGSAGNGFSVRFA